jgi:hypothetical protein
MDDAEYGVASTCFGKVIKDVITHYRKRTVGTQERVSAAVFKSLFSNVKENQDGIFIYRHIDCILDGCSSILQRQADARPQSYPCPQIF